MIISDGKGVLSEPKSKRRNDKRNNRFDKNTKPQWIKKH